MVFLCRKNNKFLYYSKTVCDTEKKKPERDWDLTGTTIITSTTTYNNNKY